MLKKNEVYVRVSSKKKARELAKLLDMFGEMVFESTMERLKNGVLSDEYPIVNYNWEWCGKVAEPTDKTKVSISELRNILANEHLKSGDVVVTESSGEKVIAVVNKTGTFGSILFEAKKWIRVSDGFLWDNKGCFDNFLRYATEEERQLLCGNKELQAGKWYKSIYGSIVNFQGGKNGYGIATDGEWYNNSYWDFSTFKIEATPEEVEQALIKEAQRRGYKKGDVLKSLCYGNSFITGDNYNYRPSENILAIDGNWLFKDGKWAEIIKSSKQNDDVAIVERLHDTLLENHGYCISSKLLTDARSLRERLKNK